MGFYGLLLFALFGVTFPEFLARPESFLRTVACLPLRAYSILLEGEVQGTVHAAAGEASLAPGQQQLQALRQRLQQAAPAAGSWHGDYIAESCAVRHRHQDELAMGRASNPKRYDQLELQTPLADAATYADFVTHGPWLLGFLQADPAESTAQPMVHLLHYQQKLDSKAPLRGQGRPVPRRILAAAAVENGEKETLRFLLEPARRVDEWPLRCIQMDDPYLASLVLRSGAMVRTVAHPNDPQGQLPGGLPVGKLMVWGYPDLGIPVGLFVDTPVDPRAVSSVTLWRRREVQVSTAGIPALLQPLAKGRLLSAYLMHLPAPGAGGQCWLATVRQAVALPEGAALVAQGRFLGLLQEPWTGQALVTPFANSTRVWSLLLLPDDPTAPVQEIAARLHGPRDGEVLQLRILGGGPALAGQLFVGAIGPHCPAGFYLGRVRPEEEDSLALDYAPLAQDSGETQAAPQVFIAATEGQQ